MKTPIKQKHKFQQYKQRNNIVSLDKIKLNTPYAMSYNPAKQYEGKVSRLDLIQTEFKKVFNGTDYEYSLRFEISPQGRYHCHGIIYFKDYPVQLYTDRMIDILKVCTLEIDTINDYPVWIEYMNKQKPMFAGYGQHNVYLLVETKKYKVSDYEDAIVIKEKTLHQIEDADTEDPETSSESNSESDQSEEEEY